MRRSEDAAGNWRLAVNGYWQLAAGDWQVFKQILRPKTINNLTGIGV